jgi:hypothetical protein
MTPHSRGQRAALCRAFGKPVGQPSENGGRNSIELCRFDSPIAGHIFLLCFLLSCFVLFCGLREGICSGQGPGPHPERKIARVPTGSASREPSLAGHAQFSSLVAAPGHGGLIRVLHPGRFPQGRTWHLGERCTAGNRWVPIGCGPNVDQAMTINLPARGCPCRHAVAWAACLDRLTKVRRVDRVPLVECAA